MTGLTGGLTQGLTAGLTGTGRRAATDPLAGAPYTWLTADPAYATTDAGGTTPGGVNSLIRRLTDHGTVGSKRHFNTSNDSYRATLVQSGGTRWQLHFDGATTHYRLTSTVSETAGSLAAAFVAPATMPPAARQVVFAGSDPTAAATWWEVGIDTDGRMYWEYSLAGTVQWRMNASTVLDASTLYTLYLTFGGTVAVPRPDFYAALAVGGGSPVEQTVTLAAGTGPGCWLGAAAGPTLLSVGATVTSGGVVRPFAGDLLDLMLFAGDIS